jgi:hypothetical protein
VRPAMPMRSVMREQAVGPFGHHPPGRPRCRLLVVDNFHRGK